ncbi:hypothetical protein GGI20_002240 [Coemansia sp. BCRC 34301]|nr:hypothetical protein GGI20_002240 [Coemansia sp. BCRC 34301]
MMDSFSHMYGSGQFNNSGQMNPMGYPAQMMGTEHMAQVPPPYSHSPFSAQTKAVPNGQMISSRIVNDPECQVFCHDSQSSSAAEFHVRQIIGADGAVFVEHVPGYHVVYVAVGENVGQAVRDSRLPTTIQRPNVAKVNRASTAASRDRPLKPCNPFIMYRNHKITQMRKENPEINQTEISREAAKLWRNESEDVREVFKAKYREEKQVYDLKKCKRGRADSMAADSDPETDGLSTPSKRSRNESSSLGLSSVRSLAKPRSRTMPNDMFGNSGARASIVTDLRKQLAARSGAAFFDTAYDQGYTDFSSSEAQQLPSMMHHQPMTIAPLVSYSPAAMPADYTHDYPLPPVGDYVLPSVADYAGGQPEYHSFVNAMHEMGGGEDQTGDVTAAAAAAAAAADFYSAAADPYSAAADSIAAAAAAASTSATSNDDQYVSHLVSHSQSPQQLELATLPPASL